MSFWRRRLTERSTWLGLGGAAAGGLSTVGQYLSHDEAHYVALAAVIFGLIAIITPTGGDNA